MKVACLESYCWRKGKNLIRAHFFPMEKEFIHYGGDLDIAGINIYQSLQRFIPSMKLFALYIHMFERIRKRQGHEYCTLTDKAGQAGSPDGKKNTGCHCGKNNNLLPQDIFDLIKKLWCRSGGHWKKRHRDV